MQHNPAIAHLYKAKREAGSSRRTSGFQNDLLLAEASFGVANRTFSDHSALMEVTGHDAAGYTPAQLGLVSSGS